MSLHRLVCLALQMGLMYAGAASAAPSQNSVNKAKASLAGPTSQQAISPSIWIERAKAGKYPAPIAATVARGKGVRVQDVFAVQGGLTGYVVIAESGEQRIYYVTPDGSTAIYGLAFDRDLNNLTGQHIASYTNALSPRMGVGTLAGTSKPAVRPTPVQSSQPEPVIESYTDDLENQALRPAWELVTQAKGGYVEGRGLDVYIVFDPACPFCHKAWRDTRPLLNQLRLHWVPVAELGDNSRRLANSFIALPEASRPAAMAALVDRSFKADAPFSTSTSAILARNAAILTSANVRNVPLIMFSNNGRIQTMVGAPSPKQLQDLLTLAAANAR